VRHIAAVDSPGLTGSRSKKDAKNAKKAWLQADFGVEQARGPEVGKIFAMTGIDLSRRPSC
jgi:hypothetical protein